MANIFLYKASARQNLLPAYASTIDNTIQVLQRCNGNCIRRIYTSATNTIPHRTQEIHIKIIQPLQSTKKCLPHVPHQRSITGCHNLREFTNTTPHFITQMKSFRHTVWTRRPSLFLAQPSSAQSIFERYSIGLACSLLECSTGILQWALGSNLHL